MLFFDDDVDSGFEDFLVGVWSVALLLDDSSSSDDVESVSELLDEESLDSGDESPGGVGGRGVLFFLVFFFLVGIGATVGVDLVCFFGLFLVVFGGACGSGSSSSVVGSCWSSSGIMSTGGGLFDGRLGGSLPSSPAPVGCPGGGGGCCSSGRPSLLRVVLAFVVVFVF